MAAASVGTLAIVAACLFVARARRPFLVRFRSDVDALVSPARIGETRESLGRNPHRAGTAGNTAVAEEIARRLTDAGLKTWSDVHDVELWVPVALSFALTKPVPRAFALHDPAKAVAEDDLPLLAYAADGDVEGPLVYAGSGAPADFDALRKAGVDARGKIVLEREEGVCLAMKALAAERAGAAGLLVYTEPRARGDAAPATSAEAADRSAAPCGTLLRFFLRPGDPRGAKAAGIDTLPKIPALAIGEDVARSLLKQMGGPSAPAAWKGRFDAPYNLGSGATRVRMTVRGRLVPASLRNVLATIPGEDPSAAAIVVGSHFDARLRGEADSASGAAVVLEAAAVLARLGGRGWKPSRPVVFALFDAEEYGMLGSAAWLEARLVAGGVPAFAFVNVDSAVRGDGFHAVTTPGLRESLDAALLLLRDPVSGKAPFESAAVPDLPRFSDDAAPFLGFSATPVVDIGFTPSFGGTHAADLARLVALYAGSLATPHFFPFRFAEISAFANRELREMSRRHPAASSWLLTSVRPLATQIDVYEVAAKEWDLRARRSGNAGGKASVLDRYVSSALGAFGGSGDVFGNGSRLWGPSVDTGCGTTALPALEGAVARGDRIAAAKEAEILAEAFVRARSELASGNLTLSGARRPTRPATSPGFRKQ